MLTREQSRHCN